MSSKSVVKTVKKAEHKLIKELEKAEKNLFKELKHIERNFIKDPHDKKVAKKRTH